MNNLLEEDEEELEGARIDGAGDKKESQTNGAHLSSEIFFGEGDNRNGNVVAKETPQNLLINCVNSLKTETCI